MLISNQGTLVRTGVDQISTSGRNTQGVRLIRLGEGEKLCGLATIPELEGDEDDIEDGEVLEEGEVTPEAPESDASDDVACGAIYSHQALSRRERRSYSGFV